jgi:hypothetical protein
MAEKGTVKGPESQIVEMTLGSGRKGAGAEYVRHHRKTLQKFTQLLRVSEEEESPAQVVKPMEGK